MSAEIYCGRQIIEKFFLLQSTALCSLGDLINRFRTDDGAGAGRLGILARAAGDIEHGILSKSEESCRNQNW